jgi:glycosyltransferase involved in cell wall biosynthesis/SAM-dependent methyltransferase
MAERYSITEFNTALKPFVFMHLFNNYHHGSVVYLDPDILVMSRMVEMESAFADGADAVLTPHILEPAENVEVSDVKMLQFGIYNLGFVGFRNTPRVREIVSWWGRRLKHDCVINLEQGLFVDQKWADLFPAFINRTRVLDHPGYNVAYWNLTQRSVERCGSDWFVNGQLVRFVHFSGNQLENPKVFSRHSGQVTIGNIGDLRLLLDEYRKLVMEQGHERYRRLPYAFNWNGASGVNLHAPSPEASMPAAESFGARAAVAASSPSNEHSAGFADCVGSRNKNPLARQLELIRTFRRSVAISKGFSGGWLPLTQRAIRAYRRGGITHLKSRFVAIAQYPIPAPASVAEVETSRLEAPAKSEVRRKLLYVDWAFPRPDQDAASVTAMCLIKIFQRLGYQITFLPRGLKFEGESVGLLEQMGVECVYFPKIKSVNDFLFEHASEFSIFFGSRAPVVAPYIALMKQIAPTTKIIFNTVDLHYLREERQAALEQSSKLRRQSLRSKREELAAIQGADVAIVLSTEELYVVREEMPAARLLQLPLIFDSIPGSQAAFSSRSDIVFIGSFPHHPNVDAACFFAEQVFPRVRERLPGARLLIIGRDPPEEIKRLGAFAGVEILGYVDDLDAVFNRAKLSVAPLRFGAGIKGKIGTSLSYGVPCIVTPMAIEGMALRDGVGVLVGDDAAKLADAVVRAYEDEDLWQQLSRSGLEFVRDRYALEVAEKRLRGVVAGLRENRPLMEHLYEIEDYDEFLRHRDRLKGEYERRLAIEKELVPTTEVTFTTPGVCAVCRAASEFLTSFMYTCERADDGRVLPNWREHLQCYRCRLVNRVRAAIHLWYTVAAPRPESVVYATEQATPLFSWLSSHHSHCFGSEFLDPSLSGGTIQNGLRNEDLTRLSFGPAELDCVLSFDVLEHVPDYRSALGEVFRCLRPGGTFLFTVPFSAESEAHIVRASLNEDGEVVHHLPAEYHGNPIDPEKGTLCYRYFGWNLLDELRDVGFLRVRALAYWSRELGYLGKEQFVFIAEKSFRG